MTSTQTTTTNHYFGVLVTLAVLASLLAVLAVRPAHASTTFTVISVEDFADRNVGDGACDAGTIFGLTQCTLRAAIQESNATPGADTIRFDIPGTGVKTISPGSPLPTITQAVTIDGYTQPGSSVNTLAKGTNADLLVELSGAGGDAGDGLEIGAGGSGSVVRGLVINGFSSQGIDVFSQSGELTNVRIEGNFVGTDPSGTTALPNGGDGIDINASNSVVGGSTPAKRNLISGNDVDGLSISGGEGTRAEGNLIGTKADGVGALGNLFNGVDVSSGTTGVSVLRNSIFSNGGLGIDLGVNGRTLNDPGDADSGANGLQNFPVLSSAKTGGGKTTITGKLNSTPNKTFTIQFYSNPSGTDEGKTFIGQKSATTNGSGNASFTFSPSSKVAVGQTITATATGADGTSEFSAPRKVVAS